MNPFNFEECLRMKVETSSVFVLDHDPVRGEMSELAVQLSKARHGVSYSINREGRKITVHCYIPKNPVA